MFGVVELFMFGVTRLFPTLGALATGRLVGWQVPAWFLQRGSSSARNQRQEQGETRCRVVNGHGVKMRFPDGTSGPSPAKTRCGRRSIIHALRAREHGPQGVLWHYFAKRRLGRLVERPNGIRPSSALMSSRWSAADLPAAVHRRGCLALRLSAALTMSPGNWIARRALRLRLRAPNSGGRAASISHGDTRTAFVVDSGAVRVAVARRAATRQRPTLPLWGMGSWGRHTTRVRSSTCGPCCDHLSG